MKKTPLKRRTPLRAAKCSLKKSRLKAMSSDKAEMTRRYKDAKNSFGPYVRSAMSGLLLHRLEAECHHVFGRQGEYLLAFVWLATHEHERIHRFGKQSRSLGWLQRPFDGMPYDETQVRPWPKSAEIHFPARFQRPG